MMISSSTCSVFPRDGVVGLAGGTITGEDDECVLCINMLLVETAKFGDDFGLDCQPEVGDMFEPL